MRGGAGAVELLELGFGAGDCEARFIFALGGFVLRGAESFHAFKADFGALDLGLDLGFQDDGGADLPAPARVDNLPAPAAQAPPRPPAPPPKPSAPPPVEDDDFDLPAPAHFDDLPAPAAGFADDLPATRDERTKKGPPRATPSLDDDFNAQFSADLDGMLAPPPVPPPPGAPRGEAAVDLTALDGALGADDAAPVKVKKKRNYIKVALIVFPTLAIAGGALTLTPAGPYGYYAITDRTNRADFEEQLTALRATARTNLANDTSVESEALANQARTHQEGQPRFAPIAHYTATIAFLHSLRFGKHGELNALGKTLLDGSSAQEAGPLRAVALAHPSGKRRRTEPERSRRARDGGGNSARCEEGRGRAKAVECRCFA